MIKWPRWLMRLLTRPRHPSLEQLVAWQENPTEAARVGGHVNRCLPCRTRVESMRALLDRASTVLGSGGSSPEVELGIARLLGVLRDSTVVGAVSERLQTGRDLHLAATLEPYFGALPTRLFENSLAGGPPFRPQTEKLTETFLGSRAAAGIMRPLEERRPAAPRVAIVGMLSTLPWFLAMLQVALGASAIAQWALNGGQTSLLTFFHVHSPLVLSSLALFEYLAAMACWRQFRKGELLRQAWLLIMAASGCRLAGMMVTSFFGWFSGRGLPAPPVETASVAAAVGALNVTIVRPLCTGLLALALLAVIRAYRQAGLVRKPGTLDRALLAVVALLTTAGIVMHSGGPSWLNAHALLSSAALGFLLAEAVLLRRPAIQMGDGLVGRTWGAYVAAIFLTVAGDMGAWAVNSAVLPWQYSWVHTSIWLLAGLAYALAPAYQIQALLGTKAAPPQWDNEAGALPDGDRAYGIMSR